MSDQQEQQMVTLLGQINEKVGCIREEMIETRASVQHQGEKIDEIREGMRRENLPQRVALIERYQSTQSKLLWMIGGTAVAAFVSTVWNRLTGGGG